MIHPTVRVAALLLLSVAHGLAPAAVVPLLASTTLFFVWYYRPSFIRGIRVIAASVASLLILGLLVWALPGRPSVHELFIGYSRWVSLTVFSVVMFLSIDAVEFLAVLARCKIPVKIVLAFSIGLRFIPILFEEARRVASIQRRKGVSFSRTSLSSFGLPGLISRMLSPLVVSMLRRVDSLNLSIALQQVERRAAAYDYGSLGPLDWLVLAVTVGLFVAAVAVPSWKP